MEWKMEIRLIMLPYVASSARLHHLLNKSQMLMGMEGPLVHRSKQVLLGVLSRSDNTEEASVLLVNMCSHIFVTLHSLQSKVWLSLKVQALWLGNHSRFVEDPCVALQHRQFNAYCVSSCHLGVGLNVAFGSHVRVCIY